MDSLKVIDLFSGAGGLSQGFRDAGCNIISAVEINKNLSQTFRNNFKKTKIFEEDISKVKSKDLLVNESKVDIVIGGPPCQGFSMSGKRIRGNGIFLNDKRNKLFKEFVRIINDLKPKIFLMENVPGILNIFQGKTKNQILSIFESIGYDAKVKVLLAADYGVPQLRKRAFFIGNNLGIDPEFLFPPKINKDYITVEDAIFDLPFIKSGQGEFETIYKKKPSTEYQKKMRAGVKKLYNHISTKHDDKIINIIKMLKEGEGRNNLPKKFQTKSIHSGSYMRIIKNKPSYTITTRFDTPPVGRVTHPIADRALTAREAARLQSFPDDFIFIGKRTHVGIQIGNAVPPLLAYEIAKNLKNRLSLNDKNQIPKHFKNYQYSLKLA
ncbi:DNA cytosine methyltransferase [Candidatus Pelagibacter bacterium nBUS_32]|jgi:DNA-cytosine methyltransferase|uniref:DNA cytosine methyltransferase n=1 Tax=Candidatus Pelagibacter bacterium nBUS_32 TaxID=3374192 RepID=UPI003EBCB464|tara:strand:- start:780 stop:1922 length:1143 start_codon:yes stop_codon:yes gene_type:complete